MLKNGKGKNMNENWEIHGEDPFYKILKSNTSFKNLNEINTEDNIDMNPDDNNVSDHEHIFNHISYF